MPTDADVASETATSGIIEVPQFDTTYSGTGADRKRLVAIMVNLSDYTIGADKGGTVKDYYDFDIDFNQHKYLMETRCSGCLTKPFSAIIFWQADPDTSGS
jgi:hypothetical protein